MSYGVGFEEAGARFIPLVGLDGDLVAQKSSGFGGGPATFFVLDSSWGEDAVDGGGRDSKQGLEDLIR